MAGKREHHHAEMRMCQHRDANTMMSAPKTVPGVLQFLAVNYPFAAGGIISTGK